MKIHIATVKIYGGRKAVTLTDEAFELISEHSLTADEITKRAGYAKINGGFMKDFRPAREDEGNQYHVYLDSFSPSGEVLGGEVSCKNIFLP